MAVSESRRWTLLVLFLSLSLIKSSLSFRLKNNGDDLRRHPHSSPLKVAIVGAGLSGLYAGLLFDSLESTIDYDILEANPSRIGGRFFTYKFYRTDNADQCLNHLYFDAGAMRFPKFKLFDRMIGDQEWSLVNYVNSKVTQEDQLVKLIPYHLTDHNNYYYINKQKVPQSSEFKDKDWFRWKQNGETGPLPSGYSAQPGSHWLRYYLEPFIAKLDLDYYRGINEIMDLDRQSIRDYILNYKDNFNGSLMALPDYIELFTHGNGMLFSSVLEVLQMNFPLLFGSDTQFVSIKGGSSQLIYTMSSILSRKPLLNQKVTKILDNNHDNSGCDNCKKLTIIGTGLKRNYDHVILTPTFEALKQIQMESLNFTSTKRLAINALRHVDCLKIGFMFKERWWENPTIMKGKPIFGGTTITDLPIRFVSFPSFGNINCTNRPSVLIASYTCFDSSTQLSSLSDIALERMTLKSLQELFGHRVGEYYTGRYYIKRWNDHGGLAAFAPGQLSSYRDTLGQSEMGGRLHFAGETPGSTHAWSVGSLETAYKAVETILITEGMKSDLEKLRSTWGTLSWK